MLILGMKLFHQRATGTSSFCQCYGPISSCQCCADPDASTGPCRLIDLVQSCQAAFTNHDYWEWTVWFDSLAAVLQLDDSGAMRQAGAGQPGCLALGMSLAVLIGTIALRALPAGARWSKCLGSFLYRPSGSRSIRVRPQQKVADGGCASFLEGCR